MKQKTPHLFLILMLAALAPTLWAGPTEGVLKEFRKTEELIRTKQITPEVRKATLESNLLDAMQSALKRRFYLQQKEILEGLNNDSLAYEKHPSSELVYFVRYRNYYVRFDYYRDPEFYIQNPKYEKFLIREEGADAHNPTTP
ncbi:MAG: hypothetical protein KDK39_03550 [Leptospiraceae bacterium]|nr:hypothetical protein [Leptospiraceae bacterium]